MNLVTRLLRWAMHTVLATVAPLVITMILGRVWGEVARITHSTTSSYFVHAPFPFHVGVAAVIGYFASREFKQNEAYFAWILPWLWLGLRYFSLPVDHSAFFGDSDNRFDILFGMNVPATARDLTLRIIFVTPLFASLGYVLGTYLGRANVFSVRTLNNEQVEKDEQAVAATQGDNV